MHAQRWVFQRKLIGKPVRIYTKKDGHCGVVQGGKGERMILGIQGLSGQQPAPSHHCDLL